jgi:plastocyanin
MRRTLALSLVLVATLVSCEGSGANDAPPDVEMVNGQRFDPESLTVNVGDTVIWANSSSETHTVTAYEAKLPQGAPYFTSGPHPTEEDARAHLSEGLIDPDERYQFTFEVPGTYEYFCLPHEGSGMKGTIIVE